jgi:HlyD family secretion protein
MNDQSPSLAPADDIASVLKLGTRTRRHGRLRRLLWLGVGLAAAFAAYHWWSASSNGPALQYKTEAAAKGHLSVVVTATGSVQPTNKVDISSELSGTVRKVNVDFNDLVSVGQVLAELDTDKLKATAESSRAKLAAARAKVADAEATLAERKVDFDRKSALFKKQVSSNLDLDTAKAALRRAEAAINTTKADVVAAEADLKLNETNLAKARILSPINGVVLARSVEPGQTVASSLQAPVLFTIAEDLTKMEVDVDVDEADVGKVAVGQKAIFSVDAYPDKKFEAAIKALHYGSEVVQGVVTYQAVLTTENSRLLLRPGMTATAEISVQQVDDALLVPNAALRFTPAAAEEEVDNRTFLQKLMPGPRFRRSRNGNDNGKRRDAAKTVYVLAAGQPRKVEVTVGPSDGRFTQVVKGELQPGDRVIVDTASAGK